jgi:hypothetical protein
LKLKLFLDLIIHAQDKNFAISMMNKSMVHKWDKSCIIHKLVFVVGSINLTIISICHRLVHGARLVLLVHIRQNYQWLVLHYSHDVEKSIYFLISILTKYKLTKWIGCIHA